MGSEPGFTVNPAVKLRVMKVGTGLGPVLVETPEPGTGLRRTKVPDTSQAWPFLLRPIGGRSDDVARLAPQAFDELVAAGVLVGPAAAARAATVFRCPLPEATPREDGRNFVAAPGCAVGEDPSGTWARGPALWVTRPLTGLRVAYELAPSEAPGVAAAVRDGAAAKDLPPDLRGRLIAAGALIAPGDTAGDEAAHAAEIRARHYTVIRALLPPGVVRALATYYRGFMAEGRAPWADSYSRYVQAGDGPSIAIHQGLAPFVRRVVGEDLEPSVVLVVSYLGGILKPHRDVLPFVWTLSVQIDLEPPGGPGWPWALYMHDPADPRRREAVTLAPGDGVLYHGTGLIHSRDRLPADHVSTSLLVHYA